MHMPLTSEEEDRSFDSNRAAPDDGCAWDQPGRDPCWKEDSSFDVLGSKLHVVGIGASAGGLEALKVFFTAMPAESGLAFVVVQHLEPTHESRMAEILGKCSAMKTVQATDGLPVEPNTIYTNPPGRTLTCADGCLVLSRPVERSRVDGAIDCFLTSLAESHGSLASCIILSGSSGLDGPSGVRAIRAAGGMCMAQDPITAQFPAMPQAAIDTGLVDFILAPADLPRALLTFARHAAASAATPGTAPSDVDALDAILTLLLKRTDSDYRCYRKPTISRRVQRRMGLRQMAKMDDYVRLLQEDEEELSDLAKDMLIGVSSFFRDVEVFNLLGREVMQPLVRATPDDSPLRAWVPGCATGEEAYSIAMLLFEACSAAGKSCPIQVFATDVDEGALETARAGIYPASILHDVSPQRLQAFFSERGRDYQITKPLREEVVFSRHNLLNDPPFSKLHLISCRNVLIYIEPPAQRTILSAFSFALNIGGYMLLGKSEGISGMDDLFETVSKQARVYRLKRPNRLPAREIPIQMTGLRGRASGGERPNGDASILPRANLDALLRHFGASVVLIDPEGSIQYFHGQTEKYLGHPKGPASLNILDLTKGTLSARLRRAIATAMQQDGPVRLSLVPLPRDRASLANLTVTRVGDAPGGGRLLAVVFEDARPDPTPPAVQGIVPTDESLIVQLEEEVRTLRAELRNDADGFDAATEELRVANEEVMSMNEELQSANEELQASKEELQSVNEELTTVNCQINDKVAELTESNDDLANLLGATEIATVFLDGSCKIRRFTPRATELLNLIASDIGRPVAHITQNFTGLDLSVDVQAVLETLSQMEKEVQGRDGRWYTVRVLPYRTQDNRIDGTVVTFSNVTRLKEIESRLRYEKTYAERVTETVRHPMIVLDDRLQVVSANHAFHETFRTDPKLIPGCKLHSLGGGQWNIPELRTLLEDVIRQDRAFIDFRIEGDFERIGHKVLLLSGRHIEPTIGVSDRLLLTIEDISAREAADSKLRDLADRLARSNAELEQFAYAISHDLQEPLRMIAGFLDLLKKRMDPVLDPESKEYCVFVMEGTCRMQAMIRDLLELSRLGREPLSMEVIDLNEPLDQALQNLKRRIDDSGAQIISEPLPSAPGSIAQLTRLFQNLISNAIKFRGTEPPEAHIAASPCAEGWRISVRDNGIGIDPRHADRVFDVFHRLHTREEYEGTGIGLAVCRKIVERHGGRIWLDSEKDAGTTFHFVLPTDSTRRQERQEWDGAGCPDGGG